MSSRPPSNRPKLPSKKSRRYTSSFSGIDWGLSFRVRQTDSSGGLEAVDMDFPSLAGNNQQVAAAANRPDDKSAGSKCLVKQVTWQERDEEHEERRMPWCRVIALLTVVVAAVVCFSTLISKKAVINTNTKAMLSNMLGVIDDTVQQQLLQQEQTRGQELLELAEQITMACGESSLLHSSSSVSSVNVAAGMATCQTLCKDHMCCVEDDEEYSCKSDVEQDCGAYAGCVALIDDNLW